MHTDVGKDGSVGNKNEVSVFVNYHLRALSAIMGEVLIGSELTK